MNLRVKMIALFALTLLIAVAPIASAQDAAILTPNIQKIRTIITTDGEIDDQCSLVRYMLYANEFELEGLVSSSSRFHWLTKEGEVFKGRDSNQQWIDAYAKVYDNLSTHAEGFPTAEYLTSINVEGNIDAPGEMAKDTEGSLLIKDRILDDRDDLLFLQVWGGTNTVCAALRSIEEEYKDTDQWEAIYKKVCDKILLWIDLDQDETLNEYLLPKWPDVKVVLSYDQFWAFGYWWRELIPEQYQPYFSREFMAQNIANDSNPLAQIYYNNLGSIADVAPQYGFEPYSFLSEGDTPNFYYILDVGLRSAEDPSYGGWAGRFHKVFTDYELSGMYTNGKMLGGLWVEAYDDGDHYKPVYRWIDDFQNDFAARMQWCTADYANANHEPVVQVAEGIDMDVTRGQSVTLTAQTYDPDADDVQVDFWQYTDADTYGGVVALTASGADQVTFTVPDDAKFGDTIHIIVEGADNGVFPMTRYQRVILKVVNPDAES